MRRRQEIKVTFIILSYLTSVVFAPLFGQSIIPNSFQENHYAYISQDDNENLGDTFYRNNEYLKCEAKNLCKQREEVSVENPLKKYAFFFRRESDDFVIPIFLKCNKNGSSFASMAETLVPLLNETVLDQSDCISREALEEQVNPVFVDDTLKALESYENGCPKQEKNCMEQIADNFMDDLSNFSNIFSLGSQEKIDAGCLTNFLANTITSIYETLKLFLYEIPTGIFSAAKAGWNSFFNQEESSSSGLLASSIMGEEMAEALSNWDLPKFYAEAKKNFFKFFGQIKEYYTELIGCTEWDGVPYYSTCTKKMNWSCPTCDNFLNFACGLASQLGSGFLLGGILGLTKSISTVANLRKTISIQPKKFNIIDSALEEINAKEKLRTMVSNTRTSARRASFRTSRATRPLTSFLDSAKDDLKFIFGIGNSFRTLIASNPATFYYNMVFQSGKQKVFKAANEYQLRNVRGHGLHRARAYALRLDSMRKTFDDLFVDFKKLRGQKFDPVLFKEINEELIEEIKDQFNGTGVVVKDLPDKSGLIFQFGDETFTYQPKLAERLKNAPDSMGQDDLVKLLIDDDPLLSQNPAVSMAPDTPKFLRDMQEQAQTSRGIFTIKPDGTDGFVYLGHFGATMGTTPEVQDCSGKLNNVELLRMQEITEYPEAPPENIEPQAVSE
ncbi:MAG: hypothetical protein K9K67_13265 [Bacteriovoracaceae bacterium]|nr:hypothetical protein [Bacteriovoracaceae bacterium]